MRNSNCNCEICDKPVYRKPGEKGRHTCCKEHRSELYKKHPEIFRANFEKGRGWNKGKKKKNGDILAYGRPRSEKTKLLISKRLKEVLTKKGKYLNCLFCRKEFYVFPSNIKRGNGKFCSKSCQAKQKNKERIHPTGEANPNWKGGDITYICEICNKQFIRRRGKIAKYCSNQCRNKAHVVRMVNDPPKMHLYDTDIELILESWLNKNSVRFEKQKPIENLTVTDFFIEPDICLYADGDYWHNLDRTKKRDVRINKRLSEMGYRVVRVLGSAIKRGEMPYELLSQNNQ